MDDTLTAGTSGMGGQPDHGTIEGSPRSTDSPSGEQSRGAQDRPGRSSDRYYKLIRFGSDFLVDWRSREMATSGHQSSSVFLKIPELKFFGRKNSDPIFGRFRPFHFHLENV